jgi:hypothetical protein
MLRVVLPLLLLVQQMNAFNIKNKINLRNIVISSAVMTTITRRINAELLNESLFISDITNMNSHIQVTSIVFDSFLVLLLFTQYKNILNYDEKLLDVELYSETQKSVNKIILVVLFVFTRNIENAI